MKYLLIAGIALLFVYEIYALKTAAQGDTISEMVWTWSSKTALLPFGFGLLCGHWFFCKSG